MVNEHPGSVLITPRPRSRPLALAIVAVWGSVLPGPPLRGDQTAVFRAEASLVEVIVRVTDTRGEFIPDLTVRDFELDDNGRRQKLVAFGAVNHPRGQAERRVASAAPRGVETSLVASNAPAGTGRLFVLLLDDLLTSPMFTLPVRRVAREFIEQHVGPDDLIAVFSTGGRGAVNQEFTSDTSAALRVIDGFMGSPCTKNPNEIPGAEDVYKVRVTTDVMASLATHLRGIRGRRVSMLWISEGIGYDATNAAIAHVPEATSLSAAPANNDARTVAEAMRRAIDALRQANVTLYGVDPRRLWSPDMALAAAPGTYDLKPCQPTRRSVDSLRTFSEETGGFAAVDTNEFREQFARIVDEASQYYVLGFQPDRAGQPGEFRRLRVRVTGRSGLRVSARSGYVVPTTERRADDAGDASRPVSEALSGTLPLAAVPLRAQAVTRPSAGATMEVHVICEVGIKDLQFIEDAGRYRERVQLALRAVDALARTSHQQQATLSLDLNAAELAVAREHGVRWLAAFEVPAGRYSVRVAAHAVQSRRTGSVFVDVEVPDLDEGRWWVGGLTVTSPNASNALTGGSRALLLELPSPPTTTRAFGRGEVLTIAAGFAGPARSRTGTVRLTIHPLSPGEHVPGPPVVDRPTTLDPARIAEPTRTWSVNTEQLVAGTFLVRVAAEGDRGPEAEAAMVIEIRP